MPTDCMDESLAELFWSLCGEREPFPRSLERYIALALPLTIVKLPKLRINKLESWLVSRGVPVRFGCVDRSLRGCLVAHRGEGVLFVDGADAENERRMTVAHELAHFLVDHWHPRAIAIERLGVGIIDVLDGIRPATALERVQSVFGNANLFLNVNFMERNNRGTDIQLWKTESRADRIALALLAPADAVMGRLSSTQKFHDVMPEIADLLHNEFGLPEWLVKDYARNLVTRWGRQTTWAASLRQS